VATRTNQDPISLTSEQDNGSAFDGKAFVRTLSGSPGVYRMLGASGDVLYVGKAGNLKKRVGSYFLKPRMDPRIAAMVAQIASIEVTLTRTEGEALLLEAQLIKSLRPRYNILLRDDKSYPFIYLSGGEDYPRMGFHRGAKSGKGRYFGPYPSAYAVRESLNLMQKLFLVRQCEDSYFRNRSRPCLQYQIKRCSAPCVGLIGVPEYQDSTRHAAMFLDGKSNEIVDELCAAMESAAASLEYERAARLRDQVATLKRVQAQHYVQGASADLDVLVCRIRSGVACVSVLFFRNGVNLGSRDFFPKPGIDASTAGVLTAFIAQYYLGRPAPHQLIVSEHLADGELLAEVLTAQSGHAVEVKDSVRGGRARFLELAEKNAEAALAMHLASNRTMHERFEALRDLLDLDELPQRLECFDISHTMGEATVASCVVFGPEGAEKSQYRRFNIAGIEGGDDYAAMRQVLERRYRRQQAGEGVLPDILLIDGGKGQVAQAHEVLRDLAIDGVLVVGVAKGPERRPGHESLIVGERTLWPGPESAALHLIQNVRDEAHRFAITGHRQRRQKAREKSRLEEIGGIGAKRRAALLKHFGGIIGVAAAGAEEIARVKGVSRDLAERIYAAFHP
jgi:excinuclease ABC subunit C